MSYIKKSLYISLDSFLLFSMPCDVVIVTVICVTGLVTVVTSHHIFFFLDQQFIMWSAMAVHGNYLVAMLH